METKNGAEKPRKKTLSGRVVSNKMDKTIVVRVESKKLNRLYKKYVIQSKKIKAHDPKNECGIDDIVRVIECRPYSKDKRWHLLSIVEKAR